jgi:hypothetical protein
MMRGGEEEEEGEGGWTSMTGTGAKERVGKVCKVVGLRI